MPQKVAVGYFESGNRIHTILVSFGSILGPKHITAATYSHQALAAKENKHRINIFPYHGSYLSPDKPTMTTTNVAKANHNHLRPKAEKTIRDALQI